MSWLARLFGDRPLDAETRRREGERLDAKRRHLRGKMARNQGEIRRAWTRYRTWTGEAAGKRSLRAEIRHLEALRKDMVKEMLKLQSEMKRLGYEAKAGHVEMH